ncbi:hypothetical protein VKT23_008631 [Stygiomarasmius scandens]|uniref:Uncharacterized protein n=1 Tax=Marasmiellus scandens TaxID=2682957 RepID=A0ABR1JN41_9AGAR
MLLQDPEYDSDGTDSRTRMSESGPKMDTIVISDNTQRHDEALVGTLSTLVGDKELSYHDGIDEDGEDTVEYKELHKGVVMDENGLEDDQ